MKRLLLIFLSLVIFVSCKAQNELPKHSVKTVATKYLRGLSSSELNGDGLMRIPYNWGPTGNYRIQIGGDTGDTILHEWVEQIAINAIGSGGDFWLRGSNFAIDDGIIATYETFTFSGDGSSLVYDDNTLTATGTGTSGTTTLTIGGATSPSFLVQANNEIRLQATSTGNVTVYNSGSRNDSTIVNENRLQDIADTKEDVITGAATTVVSSDLTADRAVISNGSGKIAVSPITSAELAELAGIESNIQDQIDAIEAGFISDSSDYWKRDGLSLIEQDAEIRVTATNQIKIGKAAGSQLTFNDSYTLLGNLTDITGFFINEADSSTSIISDSTGIRVKQNNVMEIVDDRNDVGFRRHGIVGAADYSDAIRGTPKAYTQMQTVRDYTDSLVATLDLSGVSESELSDTAQSVRDYSDLNSWLRAGNFTTGGGAIQNITTTNNLSFTPGTSSGIQFNLASGKFITSFGAGTTNWETDVFLVTAADNINIHQSGAGGMTIRKSGNGAMLFQKNTGAGDMSFIRAGTGSGNLIIRNENGPVTLTSQGSSGTMALTNSTSSGNITINNSGVRTDSSAVNEYRLQQVVAGAGGGVDEAYVSESVDSVRSELAAEIEVTSADWTPEPTAAAISDGVSFVTLTSCRYVRLGGMVTINGLIRVSANTSTEFAEVEGLPFTISGTSYNFPLNAFIGSTFLEARGNLDGSGNQLQIVEGSANAFLTWQDLAGSWFTFQVTYKTND